MYLEDRTVHHGDHRIADGGKKIGDGLQIKCCKIGLSALQLQKQLGAVAVGHFAFAVKYGYTGRCLRHTDCVVGGKLDLFAAQHAVEALHDVEQTRAAAVDDARLFQYGEKFRRALERCVHFFSQVGKKGSDRALIRDAGDRVFHCFSCNREDGSFGRRQHGAVCLLDCGFERCADRAAVRLFSVFKAFCHAAEKLGQNDAGIAPRAEQHPVRQRLHHLRQVVRIHAVERGNAAFDGPIHVDAGVSVRNGEYIEPVDLFRLIFQHGSTAVCHFGEQRAIQILRRLCGVRCLHFVFLHESYSLITVN